MFRKNIAFILLLGFLFNVFLVPQPAKAWPDVFPTGIGAVAGIGGDLGIFGTLFSTLGKWVVDTAQTIGISAAKIAGLLAVQALTQKLIGKGNNGGTISDWNKYLYSSPQQKATAQMKIFFNQASKGRISSAKYEGVGPMNYDAYLNSEGTKSFSPQPFATNIQEIATDPKQMFDGGSMKGIMTYMQCANNVACYTLTAQNQYSKELEKATTIAKSEQDKGFLPKKENGKIIQPAAIISGALMSGDKLGTDIIMGVDVKGSIGSAISEITQGVAISVISRSVNYALADKSGKNAIQNSNDQPPVSSIGYSSQGGLSIGAGGRNYSTGIGAGALDQINPCYNRFDTKTCCENNKGKWVNNSCN